MGFIGKVFKTLFAPDVEQVSTNTVTARDLLPSTSSDAPESAVMGDDKKKNSRGINSLLIPTEQVEKGQM